MYLLFCQWCFSIVSMSLTTMSLLHALPSETQSIRFLLPWLWNPECLKQKDFCILIRSFFLPCCAPKQPFSDLLHCSSLCLDVWPMKLVGSTRPSPPLWRRRERRRPRCATQRRKSRSSWPSRQKRTLRARSLNILKFLNSMVSLFELSLLPVKINVYRNYSWVGCFFGLRIFKWCFSNGILV